MRKRMTKMDRVLVLIMALCLAMVWGCNDSDDDDDNKPDSSGDDNIVIVDDNLVSINDNSLKVVRSNGEVRQYTYGEGETKLSAQALLASPDFSALHPDGISVSDVRVVTQWNTGGAEELFVDSLGWSSSDVKIKKDATDRDHLTLEDAVFYFVQAGSDTAWRVSAQPDLFPPDFFKLRTAARTGGEEDMATFRAVKKDAVENYMAPLPLKNAFAVEKVSVSAEGLDASLTSTCGYLIVAHGSTADWNNAVIDAVKPLTDLSDELYALCFLEDPMGTAEGTFIKAQEGYDNLVSRGAEEIVVVPLFVSTHSNHIEEVAFITNLGSLEDPEEALLENMISESSASVVGMTKAADAYDAIGRELSSRILAAAEGMEQDKYIVLLSHGATTEEEDLYWQEDLEKIMTDIKAGLPENFVAGTKTLTLRVHSYPKYDEKMDELREVLSSYLDLGEVFLVYNHVRQGYMDFMVVEGIGRPPYPGALGDLSPEQLDKLHQVREGYVNLGIVPEIIQHRVCLSCRTAFFVFHGGRVCRR